MKNSPRLVSDFNRPLVETFGTDLEGDPAYYDEDAEVPPMTYCHHSRAGACKPCDRNHMTRVHGWGSFGYLPSTPCGKCQITEAGK